MSKEDTAIGYAFEKELKSCFKNIQSKYEFYWHQFLDTKAARGFVLTQPSDFLVKGKNLPTMLFEAKASVAKESFSKCAKRAISPAQVGHHKKFHRAGGKTAFIFYGELENKIEIWDGKYIVDCISEGVAINATCGETLLASGSYFELEEILIHFFCGNVA